MGITHDSLDDRTRSFMAEELDLDVASGRLYVGKYLNEQGEGVWEGLLRQAIQAHDDDWLASQLRAGDNFKTHYPRATKSGATMVKVRRDAPEMLAEGEFNRFYARGLCARAVAEGIPELEVYRGKAVSDPRPESEAMIGARLPARALLDDLRTAQGVEPALGLPPGPNSGLTVRLP